MIRRLLFLGMIVSICLFVFWGCPKKAEETSGEPQKETATAAGPTQEKAAPEKAVAQAEPKEKAAAASTGLLPIYFDFDKSFVRNDAKDVMKTNAAWLKANPNVNVKIEGNCDERGTKEYNQARGQRRAVSAKKYLTDMGISAKRISLISYGKEKPSCTEATESCWQKNRRDDFVASK